MGGPRTKTPKRPSPGRIKHPRLVLAAMSLVVAAVVLGAIEGALRLAGYGGYPPTFRAVGRLDDGSTLIFTDHGGPTSYFFANRSRPGSLDPAAFVMPKPAGTFRVFVVGESAARGNPYPRALTSAAFLQAMLADAWPDRRVEVVNLGVTAIASFPALGILTESLAYEPDMVVVYLGNNDFFGAYGVASLHSAGRSPRMIRLIRATRSLATAQFIDAQFGGFDTSDPRTLMEAMVGKSFIGPRDSARSAAARNLGAFVGDMVDRCRLRGVPVVVCTPPANERDLAPLGESSLAGLAPSDRSRVEALLVEPSAEGAEEEAGAAIEAVRNAIQLAPDHATLHYRLGRALHAQGQFDDAAAAFQRALDLDPMPWRPPSASVEAIRRAAERPGAILCDLAGAFRAASPGGAVGWELMADHVHPSLAGQELVARSIVRALADAPESVRVPLETAAGLPGDEAYLQRLGANPYDAYAAAHAMRQLGAIEFFRRSNPALFERNETACKEIEAASSPGVVEQLRAWADPATHSGEARPVSGMVAVALMEEGDLRSAAALFDVASRSVTPYGTWNLEYVYKGLVCRLAGAGRLDDEDRRAAAEAIDRAAFLVRTGRSRSGGAELWAGFLCVLVEDFAQAVPFLAAAGEKLGGANRVAADEALVRALVATGRPDEARAVIDRGMQGPFAEAYRAMLGGRR